METADKNDIANSIARKLKGAVPRCYIYDALAVIIDYIEEKVLNNEVVIVKNFGTFASHTRLGHMRRGSWIRPFKKIKFYTSPEFKKMICKKANSLKKTQRLEAKRKKTRRALTVSAH